MLRRTNDQYQDDYTNYPKSKKSRPSDEYDPIAYHRPNNRCADSKILEDIKELFETRCKEIEESIKTRNLEIIAAVSEQQNVLKELTEKEIAAEPDNSIFPINSEYDLRTLNDEIVDENRKAYISTIVSFLRNGVAKNFNNVLGNEIIVNFNLDGTHGKKKLRDYKEFFNVLIAAIESLMPHNNAEEELRKAFQTMKKRHYKRVTAERSAKGQ